MKSCTKPYSVTSTNPKASGSNGSMKGYKDGGYILKPEEHASVEGRQAAENRIRDAQIKADAEAMKNKYPEKNPSGKPKQ